MKSVATSRSALRPLTAFSVCVFICLLSAALASYGEILLFVAMLAALASMLPLFIFLCRFKYFAPLLQPVSAVPKRLPPKCHLLVFLSTILASGITFPLLTHIGYSLIPLPEAIFRLTIGNGFITWLTFLMLVSLFALLHWYRNGAGNRMGWELYDIGLGGKLEKKLSISLPMNRPRRLIPRAVLMAFALCSVVYLLLSVSGWLFAQDFRFIWLAFRPFRSLSFGQFLLYLPFFAAFFIVNAGVNLYGLLRLPEYSNSVLNLIASWLYSVPVILGGLIIIAVIHNLGPGMEILLPPLSGTPFMSILVVLIPLFLVFFFFSTWLFRKSGNVYTGSFVLAILTAWVLTSSAIVF